MDPLKGVFSGSQVVRVPGWVSPPHARARVCYYACIKGGGSNPGVQSGVPRGPNRGLRGGSTIGGVLTTEGRHATRGACLP